MNPIAALADFFSNEMLLFLGLLVTLLALLSPLNAPQQGEEDAGRPDDNDVDTPRRRR